MQKACRSANWHQGKRLNTSPPVAVFHTEEGELFAIDATWIHQDASLADGGVECPLDASRFYLDTGSVEATAAKLPVRTRSNSDRQRHPDHRIRQDSQPLA